MMPMKLHPLPFHTDDVIKLMNGDIHQLCLLAKFPNRSIQKNLVSVQNSDTLPGFVSYTYLVRYTDDSGSIQLFQYDVPYKTGDFFFIRETWNHGKIDSTDDDFYPDYFFSPTPVSYDNTYYDNHPLDQFFYRADQSDFFSEVGMYWKPCTQMPLAAARTFLEITDVQMLRLQDVTLYDVLRQGFQGLDEFREHWDSHLPFYSKQLHDWMSNPAVILIDFETCAKSTLKERNIL